MKVLLISPYFSNVYGGISSVINQLLPNFKAVGVSVDLITTNADDGCYLDVPLGSWIDQDNYRVRYFSGWHKQDFIISFSLIFWLLFHAKNYDLIHSHTLFSPMISVVNWISRLYGIPYIMTPHGMLEPWALSYKSYKKKWYYRLIEQPLLQKAAAIHCLATSEADHIKQLGITSSIFIVPNGVDPLQFSMLPSPDLFYQHFPHTVNQDLVLFLGRIDPKKGLDILAQAWAKIYLEFARAHLIIAGPDSIGFLPTVQTYFEKAHCLSSVTFTGMLTGQLKLAALAAASVYVAPYYSEGFSMSVLEGMAAGLPCVITTGCNFPEAKLAQVAYVVDPVCDQIAEGIRWGLGDRFMAQKMGDRARDFILSHYTWEISAKQISLIYMEISQKNRTTKLP